MHTLQHILLSYIDELNHSQNFDLKRFQQSVPYIILPDAIRFYTKERRFSHFEISKEDLTTGNNAFNGMIFPKDLKHPEIYLVHAYTSPKESIAGRTSIDFYEELNKHLDLLIFSEIREHLEQDNWSRNWMHQSFDCSRSSKNIFRVAEYYVDGKEFRKLINILKADNLIRLISFIKKEYNIDVEKNWIEENIFQSLSDVYDKDMYQNTIKFLNIEEIIEDSLKTSDIIPNDVIKYFCEQQFDSVMKYVNAPNSNLPRHYSNWC